MASTIQLPRRWQRSLLVGLAIALIGIGLRIFQLGGALSRLSFDLPFAFTSSPSLDELVVVQMDEPAYFQLGQTWGRMWDRRLHARLLNKLKEDGCRLVIFDVVLADPGSPEADSELAEAIRRHGAVVLAADRVPISHPGIRGETTRKPERGFLDVAAGWGLARVDLDPDGAVRRQRVTHPVVTGGSPGQPSLAEAAAAMLGGPRNGRPIPPGAELWMRYYGPYGTVRNLSYHLALDKPKGYFRGAVALIGGQPRTRFVAEEIDEFRTPFTRWDGVYSSGAEIVGTQFLNLHRGDWLARVPLAWELLLLAGSGFAVALGLHFLRPLATLAAGGAGVLAAAAVGIWSFWGTGTWFSWMIIAAVQIPAGVLAAVTMQTSLLARQLRGVQQFLELLPARARSGRAVSAAETSSDAVTADAHAVVVPDYEPLRRVGRGAYGEVWLARTIVGTYCAVKIVKRGDFRSSKAYEREFRGVQHYTPLSMKHRGLVPILHAGRNEAEGYYYYVMEAADDIHTGRTILPESYSPRTLATDLQQKKSLPARECVALLGTLLEALSFLHSSHLIHRDIKPSNIIFVNGVPKLADLGLVTAPTENSGDLSWVGTEGYIPPEGPGSVSADLYGMGKVLYEALTGLDRRQFPELPAQVEQRPDFAELRRLNPILLKACAPSAAERYLSAEAMLGDLLEPATPIPGSGAQ